MTGEMYRKIDRAALDTVSRSLYYIDTTSGTTGSPKSRYVSLEDDDIDIHLLARSLSYASVKHSDVILVVDVGDPNLYGILRKALPRARAYFWGIRPPLGVSLRSALTIINPNILLAFGNTVNRCVTDLCYHRQDGGRLRSVLYTGEQIHGTVGRKLADNRVECFGLYSSIELGFVAAECAEHDGMHVFEDAYRLEIQRDRRSATGVFKHEHPSCAHGRLLVSTLLSRGKPAIRYSTGDVVFYTEAPCDCGSVMPRIKFDRRSAEVISLYGAKVPYEELLGVVYPGRTQATALQVQISEASDITTLHLCVPRERGFNAETQTAAIVRAVESYPGLAFLVDQGVLRVTCKVVPTSVFDVRKAKKLIDLRPEALR